jgi:hypothetical protein
LKSLPFPLVLSALLLAAPSFAQSPGAGAASPQDLAIAESSFNEAVKLAQDGNCKDAIPKYELSMKVDPAAGTALNVGLCYEQVGRTASAYGAYSQAAGLARIKVNSQIREKAEAQMAAISPKLSKLELRLPKRGAPKGLAISIDGKAISADALGVGIPVDPGKREIEASATGKRPWKTTLTVEAQPTTTPVDIPELADAAVAPRAEEAGMPLGAKVAVIGLAAAGVVGIGVGAVFGIDSMDKNAASKKLCEPADPTRCSAAGVDLRKQAYGAATAANVGIGVGAGALVAACGVLLIARFALKPAPGSDAAVTAVSVGPSGAVVQGQW